MIKTDFSQCPYYRFAIDFSRKIDYRSLIEDEICDIKSNLCLCVEMMNDHDHVNSGDYEMLGECLYLLGVEHDLYGYCNWHKGSLKARWKRILKALNADRIDDAYEEAVKPVDFYKEIFLVGIFSYLKEIPADLMYKTLDDYGDYFYSDVARTLSCFADFFPKVSGDFLKVYRLFMRKIRAIESDYYPREPLSRLLMALVRRGEFLLAACHIEAKETTYTCWKFLRQLQRYENILWGEERENKPVHQWKKKGPSLPPLLQINLDSIRQFRRELDAIREKWNDHWIAEAMADLKAIYPRVSIAMGNKIHFMTFCGEFIQRFCSSESMQSTWIDMLDQSERKAFYQVYNLSRVVQFRCPMLIASLS